jgi:DNA polymerase-3 subunit delta
MTFEQIMSELKAGLYKPVYFLTGEEPFFIDLITQYMVDHALPPEARAFNQIILYGRDTDMTTILHSAMKFPMMAARQLILVREAQALKSLEGLEGYLSSPQRSTTLVFAYKYKKIDKRTKVGKTISEKSVYFESSKLWEDKIPAWITAHLESGGYQIEPKAAVLLTEFLGSDLGKINQELDKLILLLGPDSKKITSTLIEKNIGISKDYNNFELNRAMAMRDVVRANRIIKYFRSTPKNYPLLLTISSMFYYFSKILQYHSLGDKSKDHVARELGIRPFHVNEYQQAARTFPLAKTIRIISWLREYDIKSKGASPASDGDLLTELVFKIMH